MSIPQKVCNTAQPTKTNLSRIKLDVMARVGTLHGHRQRYAISQRSLDVCRTRGLRSFARYPLWRDRLSYAL